MGDAFVQCEGMAGLPWRLGDAKNEAMVNTPLLDRQSYEHGKVIFSQGQPGNHAFVVEQGEVHIFKDIDGQVVKLGEVNQGGIFGEMAVIDGSPRMATAIANGHTVVVRVPKSVFTQKLANTDTFIRGLLTIFLKNLRAAHKLYNKRPRSLADHLTMLDAYSLDLRTYVASENAEGSSAEVVQALGDLEDAVARVRNAAQQLKDRRDSVIGPDDPKGVTLRAVLDKG